MIPLVLVLAPLALFAGFLALTKREAHTGARLFSLVRSKLDVFVERFHFVLVHVDLEAFLKHESRAFLTRLVHDTVHISLLIVRAVERVLTRAIRQLRTRHNIPALRSESGRPFVKTISQFKRHLEATRPPIPEI
jgi:hypothetical protein